MILKGWTTTPRYSVSCKSIIRTLSAGSSAWAVTVDLNIPHRLSSEKIMSKEQKTNKEAKKKSAMTPKEKKAAKKLKKESKESNGLFDH